jgi:hypothetical protein
LRGVETGELPGRGWLGATERVLKLAESKIGRRAAVTLIFSWPQVLPEKEIANASRPLMVQFREKRLRLWRERIQPPSSPA